MAIRFFTGFAGLALAGFAWASAPDEPLDPGDAFRPSVRLALGSATRDGRAGLLLAYRIAPGYYLYRDRFQVSIDPPRIALDAPQLPKGLAKDDPFVGRTEIYRHGVTIEVPVSGQAAAGDYTLKVIAQGCLEGRLCYAPFTQELRVNIPPGFQVSDAPVIRPFPPPSRGKP